MTENGQEREFFLSEERCQVMEMLKGTEWMDNCDDVMNDRFMFIMKYRNFPEERIFMVGVQSHELSDEELTFYWWKRMVSKISMRAEGRFELTLIEQPQLLQILTQTRKGLK